MLAATLGTVAVNIQLKCKGHTSLKKKKSAKRDFSGVPVVPYVMKY